MPYSSVNPAATRLSLPVLWDDRHFDPELTTKFVDLIGKHLGDDQDAYREYLETVERLLIGGADPNIPHRNDRLGPWLKEYRCENNGKNTATDFYLTLERMYLDLARKEIGEEENSAGGEQRTTSRPQFCRRLVELLRSYGGLTAEEIAIVGSWRARTLGDPELYTLAQNAGDTIAGFLERLKPHATHLVRMFLLQRDASGEAEALLFDSGAPRVIAGTDAETLPTSGTSSDFLMRHVVQVFRELGHGTAERAGVLVTS